MNTCKKSSPPFTTYAIIGLPKYSSDIAVTKIQTWLLFMRIEVEGLLKVTMRVIGPRALFVDWLCLEGLKVHSDRNSSNSCRGEELINNTELWMYVFGPWNFLVFVNSNGELNIRQSMRIANGAVPAVEL